VAIKTRSDGSGNTSNPRVVEGSPECPCMAAHRKRTDRATGGLGCMAWLPMVSICRGEVDGEVVEDGMDDGDWNGSSEILLWTVSSGR
jgi:hypothetical protein